MSSTTLYNVEGGNNLPSSSFEDEERVVLNVGGQRFEVSRSTLTKYPNSKLGHMFLAENKHLLKPDKKGEFFFDRNPKIFEVILDFYRTGKLVVSPDIPTNKLREELKFFELQWEEVDEEENKQNNNDDMDDSHAEIDIRTQPPEKIIETSIEFIRGKRSQIKEGIKLLEELVTGREEFKDNAELWYYIAFGCHRLGLEMRAREILEKLQEKDPSNRQIQDLKTLAADKRSQNMKLGAIAVIGFLGGILLYFRSIHMSST